MEFCAKIHIKHETTELKNITSHILRCITAGLSFTLLSIYLSIKLEFINPKLEVSFFFSSSQSHLMPYDLQKRIVLFLFKLIAIT